MSYMRFGFSCVALIAAAWMLVQLNAGAQPDPFGSADFNPFGGEPTSSNKEPVDPFAGAKLGKPTASNIAQVTPVIWTTHFEKTEQLFQALEQPLVIKGLCFEDAPLDQVIESLGNACQLDIQIDLQSLDDLGLSPDDPVTISLPRSESISLRSLMTLMLRQLDLTFVVDNEVILVLSEEEALTRLKVAVYPVTDMVAMVDEASGEETTQEQSSDTDQCAWAPPTGTSFTARRDPRHSLGSDTESLCRLIMATVASDSWVQNGGPEADIRAISPGFLVVTQTEEVHWRIRGLLTSLRLAKQHSSANQSVASENSVANECDKPSAEALDPFGSSAPDEDPFGGGGEYGDPFGGSLNDDPFGSTRHKKADPFAGAELGESATPEAESSVAVYWTPPRTAASEKLYRALERPVITGEMSFEDAPMSEVLESLGKACRVPIHLDLQSLNEMGLSPDAPFSLEIRQAKDVTLRSLLQRLLRQLELTCIVENEVLLVLSEDDASEKTNVGVYQLSELIPIAAQEKTTRTKASHALSGFGYPTLKTVFHVSEELEALIGVIRSTVASETWVDNGGAVADMSAIPPGLLVVTQTDEVHREIHGLLSSVYLSQDRQDAKKKVEPAETKLQSTEEIEQALQQGLGGEGWKFEETPLTQVIQSISKAHKLNIVLDEKALEKVSISPSDKVSLAIKNVTLRSALRILLRQLDLAYVVDDAAVLITSEARAHEKLNGKLPSWLMNHVVDAEQFKFDSPEVASNETPSYGHALSSHAKKIEQALREPLTDKGFEFRDTPLSEVVEFIRDEYGIEVQLDNKALNDLGLSGEDRITFRMGKRVSLRSALKLMLPDLDLTYVVDNEILFITSQDEALTRIRVAVYPVGDILIKTKVHEPGSCYRETVDEHPAAGVSCMFCKANDFETLIDTILSTVASDTWVENGGPEADMRPLPPGLLVVSQTEEVHEQIRGLLAAIRQANKHPFAEGPERSAEEEEAIKPDEESVLEPTPAAAE